MVGLVGDMMVYLTDDSGDREESLALGYILEVIGTELRNGLYVGAERKGEISLVTLGNGAMVTPFVEVEHTRGEIGLEGG